MIRRIGSILLAVFLLAACVQVDAEILSDKDKYDAALEELRKYMIGESNITLDHVLEQFKNLGYYQHSIMLALYTDILIDIENEDFSQISTSLAYLRMNEKFYSFLLEDETIGSVDELEKYAIARQAESENRITSAISGYRQCSTFLDSMLRLMLLQDNYLKSRYQEAITWYNKETYAGYQKAYEIFLEISLYGGYEDSDEYMVKADSLRTTPKPTAKPTPKPTATPKPTQKPTAKSNVYKEPLKTVFLTPAVIKTLSKGVQVFTGPGQDYYQVSTGISFGGGTLELYGMIGDWYLIHYWTTKNGQRVGYVSKNVNVRFEGNGNIQIPELSLSEEKALIYTDCFLTDDPYDTHRKIDTLVQNTEITYLATLKDPDANGQWAYVEVMSSNLKKKVRGFVPLDSIRFCH